MVVWNENLDVLSLHFQGKGIRVILKKKCIFKIKDKVYEFFFFIYLFNRQLILSIFTLVSIFKVNEHKKFSNCQSINLRLKYHFDAMLESLFNFSFSTVCYPILVDVVLINLRLQ